METGIGNNKINIEIDFGQAQKYWRTEKLRDEKGNSVEFNSMIDAMNGLGADGWEFVQAYVIPEKEGGGRVCWLLKKTIGMLTDEEKAEVYSRFRTDK